MLIQIIGLGQNNQIDSSCFCNEKRIITDSTKVFYVVEEMPIYSGGDESLIRFFKENIKLDSKINGKIWITFNVNCKGIAYGFQTLKKEGNIKKENEIELVNGRMKNLNY